MQLIGAITTWSVVLSGFLDSLEKRLCRVTRGGCLQQLVSVQLIDKCFNDVFFVLEKLLLGMNFFYVRKLKNS